MEKTKRTWLAAAFAAVALAGCGGGGGGGSEAAPAPAPVANAPGPAPGPAPDPGTPPLPPERPPAGYGGRLWHNDYALDYMDGTQIASPSGDLPALASAHEYATPWPDGKTFVFTEWNVYDEYSDLVVVDLASGQALYRLKTDGYLRDERPSPASRTTVMVTHGEDSISPAETLIVDLTTMTVLRRFPGDTVMNWLPDGRYLRMTSDGTLIAGDPAGAEQTVGLADPPDSFQIQDLWVNRQGTKIAYRVLNAGTVTNETDLWVSDMDGRNFERFTSTKMSYAANWSPDGRHIAFNVDTGHVCTGAGCIGTCETWVAPVTSRNVRALPAVGDAERFKVRNRQGTPSTLGCDLLGWTD